MAYKHRESRASAYDAPVTSVTPTLVVHGGAGNPRDGGVADEPAYHEALAEALATGRALLDAGAPALDAAEAAVRSLEDCALFNAGRGSVLTSQGRVEMDAAVMDGATRRAGACAAVTGVRHPVSLSRLIMETTPHVLVIGSGAEELARERGLEFEDPEWFITDRERRRHAEAAPSHGTVGAVALDADGRVAAATSTGGVRGQLPGRVGDTPQIGSGTYADDTVAVSCTGTGEQFIHAVAGHEVAALVRHAGVALPAAAARAIDGLDGGLIAVGADGRIAMPFNTALMYRGWSQADATTTAIWRDEGGADG
jgi:beta-aspartyl-peptidase (threonine type)